MYKSDMKKINFAVSDIEYQNLQYLKSLFGLKTDSSCFRFCLEQTFNNKKKVCSNISLRKEFDSFLSDLNNLLEVVKK